MASDRKRILGQLAGRTVKAHARGERDAAVAEGGYSPGHVAYRRASDKTLMRRRPLQPEPPHPQAGSTGAEPSLVLFSHGPPLHDGDGFVRFVESLPA